MVIQKKSGTQSETLGNKIIWKYNKVYLSVCWLGEMNPNTNKNGLNFYMSNPQTSLNDAKSCDIWTKEGKFSQVRYVYRDVETLAVFLLMFSYALNH